MICEFCIIFMQFWIILIYDYFYGQDSKYIYNIINYIIYSLRTNNILNMINSIYNVSQFHLFKFKLMRVY